MKYDEEITISRLTVIRFTVILDLKLYSALER